MEVNITKATNSNTAYHLYWEHKNALDIRAKTEAESVELARHYFEVAGLTGDKMDEAIAAVTADEKAKTVLLGQQVELYFEQWDELCGVGINENTCIDLLRSTLTTCPPKGKTHAKVLSLLPLEHHRHNDGE